MYALLALPMQFTSVKVLTTAARGQLFVFLAGTYGTHTA